jgi:peptidoglycan/xylan/chitin deacetylase (PgdA/CDA1 family)
MNNLAIMYHYVQAKGLKGIVPLEPADFEKQVEWAAKNYDIITPDEMKSTKGQKPFCILTFDDATKDQYEIAFDILKRKGIPAYFTLLSGPLVQKKVPVVHLVHAVLSFFEDEEIWEGLRENFEVDIIPDIIGEFYSYEKEKFRRFNKYALNFVLSEEESRNFLENKLLTIYNSFDDFIHKYYISVDEWRKIKESGMTIGVHATNHRAYSGDAEIFFKEEIAPCLQFIQSALDYQPKWYTPAFGGGTAYMEMMQQLEPILKSYGFEGGFTTQHGYIDQEESSFWHNRIDCIKLPPILY